MSDVLTLDLLIEPEQLWSVLTHPLLRVVDLSRNSVYAQLHLPNAVQVQPKQLLHQQDEAMGLLPEADQLQALVDALQLSPQHHVVAYDDEGGAWAGRLLWNLHCAGFYHTSLLNGGIHAWLAAGLPTTAEVSQIINTDGYFQVQLKEVAHYRIGYDELLSTLQQDSLQLWDCRTADEYTGLRLAARRGGHIPSALHFEWSTALDRENHLKLQPLSRIKQRLTQSGFDLNQPVVVYCQSHHRSGLAYMLARILDWPVRAYDGAWSEWGNRLDSPIIRGESPS